VAETEVDENEAEDVDGEIVDEDEEEIEDCHEVR